jgi:hypothetical protein
MRGVPTAVFFAEARTVRDLVGAGSSLRRAGQSVSGGWTIHACTEAAAFGNSTRI